MFIQILHTDYRLKIYQN